MINDEIKLDMLIDAVGKGLIWLGIVEYFGAGHNGLDDDMALILEDAVSSIQYPKEGN